MGIDTARQEPAVIGARLHHDGKICQLCGAVVELQAVQIVPDDLLRRVALGIALRLVDLHQHLKGIDKDMSAAHAGV